MYSSTDIAKYFLSLDPDRKFFTKKLTEKNGCTFYEGNVRLNKYLHLAQNVYIAKYGKLLFTDELYALANGAASLPVMDNFAKLYNEKNIEKNIEKEETESFLNKIFLLLKDKSIDELVELSHEDEEWVKQRNKKQNSGYNAMESLKRKKEYEEQYENILLIMDKRM